MVEYMMVISQYRFGLYNTQIDKLFNWIHGNNVGTLRFVGLRCPDDACIIRTGFFGCCRDVVFCRDVACNVPTADMD